MSVNVEDISEKKADSTSFEESLVKEYESKYSLIYTKIFVFRVIFFIFFLLYIFYVTYVINRPGKASSLELFVVILSLMIALFSLYIRYVTVTNLLSSKLKYEKETNKLEDSIIKWKLEERFSSDSELKDRIEDFYIELNSLTKAKYEMALRFYAYEFYLYAIISSLIAGFFIFRLL